MAHRMKGAHVLHRVTEEDLEEVSHTAGLMPLKSGSKVVWHAASGREDVATYCGIKYDDLVDPQRLNTVATFQCGMCREAYDAEASRVNAANAERGLPVSEPTWDEALDETLARIGKLADRKKGIVRR